MVSESIEASSILNEIIHGGPPSFSSKKGSNRALLELTRKSVSDPEDHELISQFWQWFNSLSTSEKHRSLTLYHPLITEILRKMHFKKLSEGYIVFSLDPVKGRFSNENLFEANFKAIPRPNPALSDSQEVLQSEKLVEQSVRLSDTYAYLDTLTVTSSMVEQTVDLIRVVSKNEAFSTPCKGVWEPASKKTIFELPAWLLSSTGASLAAWISAVLEESVWVSFWEYYEQKRYKPVVNEESVGVYFNEISRSSQINLVGNYELLVQFFNKIKSELNSGKHMENWPFSVIYFTGMNYFGVYSLFNFNSSINLTETLNKACLYRSVKSVEIIEETFEEKSSEDFLEFISCSPLNRAGSPFDLLCRKIVLNIKNALTEQNAEDLLQEDTERRPQDKPKRRKKEHKATHLTSSSTCSSEPAVFSPPVETPPSKFSSWPKQQKTEENLEDFKLVTPVKLHKKQQRTKTRKTRKTEELNRQRPVKAAKKLAPAERNPPSSLASEIFRFSQFTCSKIQSRTSDVQHFLNYFQDLLKEIGLDFHITLFGSYPTGLALTNSDLDLLLTNPQMTCPMTVQVICSQLAMTLMHLPWVYSIKPIPTARVPVIKLEIDMFYFNPSVTAKVDVDISFDSSTLNPQNGVATMKMTKELLETHRHMKSLVIVVKEILAANELNSAYLGGLSSYAVSIWVCAYIKRHSFIKIDFLLMGFLEFFGSNFDPHKTGVCIYNGFFELELSMAHSVTRDPMDLSLNVTRTAYKINEVLKLFATAHKVLKENNKLRDIFKPLIN